MDRTKLNEIQGVILFALALLFFLSFISFDPSDVSFFTSEPHAPVRNFAGIFGSYLAAWFFFIMGMSAYAVPSLITVWAVARFFGITPQKVYFKVFGTIFLVLASSALFALLVRGDNAARFKVGGIVGLAFSDFLVKYLGRGGAFIVIGVLFLLSMLLATEFLLLPFLAGVYRGMQKKSQGPIKINAALAREGRVVTPQRQGARCRRDEDEKIALVKKEEARLQPAPAPPKREILISTHAQGPSALDQKKQRSVPELMPVSMEGYKLPSLELLDSPPPMESRKIKDDFQENARILEETLKDFDIEAKVVEINRGPVITRYELEPAPGVKIHRFTSLSDNIALAMKAQSVRIVAPIPGKGTIGVEVPNSVSTLVYLRDVLDSKEYREHTSKLKLAIGKDIAGMPVIADLATMPHLLIAGATGSGKTVCINALITSLLLYATPHEIKFIMIDPKRVELAVFNDLPHLLAPVVTDTKKVAVTLDWVVSEMDTRYELFAKTGVRNIDLYNEKSRGEKLPYIIVVIDELADLMMVAQQDVEGAITRLAQLSRAVGIHIILATQRPSVDVITGVIKANFPARISFKVASKVDSRTVLDMNGADKLLGRGDMLFIEPGASKPVRAQCSLISDREIERITQYIKQQRGPEYAPGILETQKKTSMKKFDRDEVYQEAVKMVLETKQASVSLLQRRLGLGYTRAARLIDMMEEEGVVGPYQGSKPRDILISMEEYTARTAQNT